MNRRQFFQSAVAVVVAPEVKPPFITRCDVRSLYPAELSMLAARQVKEMLNASYGKFLYADTDGVVVYV